MFNGSRGRLELEVIESSFRLPFGRDGAGVIHGNTAQPNAGGAKITLHPLWEQPKDIEIPDTYDHAGHGGGDKRMLSVLFGPTREDGGKVDEGDASKQKAGVGDGTMALAVGLAANESFRTGKFVRIEDLKLEG
jgi:hypothetical protein